MGIIKDMLERARERKRKFQDFEDNDRVVEGLGERKKSHNERELLKILEREKQEAIAEALRLEDKRRQLEERKKSRDAMMFNSELFSDDNNILNWGVD